MSVLDRNVVDFGHEDDDKVTVWQTERPGPEYQR